MTRCGAIEAMVDRHCATSDGHAASMTIQCWMAKTLETHALKMQTKELTGIFYKDDHSQFTRKQYFDVHITPNMELEELDHLQNKPIMFM